MRVAVVNEVSAANKNADIIKALEGFGCRPFSCKNSGSRQMVSVKRPTRF